MRKNIVFVISLLVALSMLSACATPTPIIIRETEIVRETAIVRQTQIVENQVMITATPAPTEIPADYAGRIAVRWFVGLGAGTRPNDIEAQNQVVDAFNRSQDKIYLQLEIVPNASAYQILQTEIAAGAAPDIVGPVGVRGANGFQGLWLDLAPYIAKTKYDLSDFDPALVDYYKFEGEGQIGIPFAVFPSFIYYNTDLFEEAGLPLPPHKYGEMYDGKPWTVEAMAELGKKLTVDSSGNDATSPDFDAANIVQFGYHGQWTDPRGNAALFGPGSFVDADGNAQIPDNWRAAFKWYYDAMWNTHFMPNDTQVNSDLLANGNPFNSGNVAMVHCHLWYTCCNTDVGNWDIAAVPSYNGESTAKLHNDTFRILGSTQNPDAAFEVLSYLLGPASQKLLLTYGGLPARQSAQDDFFVDLDEKFAPLKIDWQVAIDSLSYPDNPSHEGDMPNFLKADDKIKAFGTLIGGTPDLDIDAELDKLKIELQAIFDEVK